MVTILLLKKGKVGISNKPHILGMQSLSPFEESCADLEGVGCPCGEHSLLLVCSSEPGSHVNVSLCLSFKMN